MAMVLRSYGGRSSCPAHRLRVYKAGGNTSIEQAYIGAPEPYIIARLWPDNRVYAVRYRGCGECDCHGGALPELGLGGDGVAEGGAYSLSEEEAHAGGFRGHAPVFTGEERVEDTWKVLNRDSDSVIADCKRQGGRGDVGSVMAIDRELIDYDRDALTATG